MHRVFHRTRDVQARRQARRSLGQKLRRPAQRDARPKLAQQMDRGPRHPAVINIADDGNLQSLQRFLVAQNGVGIEQGLRGMLVHAVTRIDHRNIEIPRHQRCRARPGDGGSRSHPRPPPAACSRCRAATRLFRCSIRWRAPAWSWRPATWRRFQRNCGCAWKLRKTDSSTRLPRSKGRGLSGFIRRASLSRPRMSGAPRCSMPSRDPRAACFMVCQDQPEFQVHDFRLQISDCRF